jgi:hypothetical protein
MKLSLIASLCLTSLILASCTSSGDEITLTPRKVQPKPPVAISSGVTDTGSVIHTGSTLSGVLSSSGDTLESILAQVGTGYTVQTYDTKNLEKDLAKKVDINNPETRSHSYQGHKNPDLIRGFVQSLNTKQLQNIQLSPSTQEQVDPTFISPLAPICCTAYSEEKVIPLKNGIVILGAGGQDGWTSSTQYITMSGSELMSILHFSQYNLNTATVDRS